VVAAVGVFLLTMRIIINKLVLGVMVLPGDVREITEDVVRLTLLLGQGVNLRALRGEIIPKVVIRFPLLQEVIIRIPVRAG